MDDLLTARQVQELLKVDRTTVYRMLKDGRLSGIKIGKNWRFLRKNIDVLLQEQSHQEKTTLLKAKIFPGHCIQGLQDIFSEVAGVSCVAVDSEATFLTQASNPSPFCQKIQSTPEGRAACRQSWKKIIKNKRNHAPFHVCHAGLNYTVACIRMANQIESYILCGQFVESAEQKKALQASIPQVAQKLGLKEKDLRHLEDQVYLLTPRVRKNLKLWLERLAQSLIDLTSERNDLVNRLHKIHQLSAFQEE